jgi:dihydrodipicolinate synthase/N-acetylneuraminate lyase
MDLSDLHSKRKLGRKPIGMAAMLLPFTESGEIAEAAYAKLLHETVDAGLTPAVNMDTGYANLISDSEKLRMLKIAQRELAGKPFIAGAFVEGQDGLDVAELYRREVGRIAEHGGTPILFQTSRLHQGVVSAQEVVDTYDRATKDVETAYGFELGKMFAPTGEIWSDEVIRGIMQIPQIKGAKHSSLDRMKELERIEIRDEIRPDFLVLTGNDLGIDMIEYGSDYLLGLAAFSPAKFAERDRLWAAQDPGYLKVADALQLLGNIAFRPAVPAYKHSCAAFLHLLGKIPSARTHPRSPERPEWEAQIMRDCAARLELI